MPPYEPSLSIEEGVLPGGRKVRFKVVRHPGAVAVVPMVGPSRLILVRQYRPTVGRWLLEVPAGTIEPGEAPEECARRELVEETGYEASELHKLFEAYLAPGYSDELIHVFVARGLRRRGPRPEADELIELVEVDLEEAVRMVERGEIADAKTISAVLFLALRWGHGCTSSQ